MLTPKIENDISRKRLIPRIFNMAKVPRNRPDNMKKTRWRLFE
jgi:hypothetical protein